MDGKQKDEKTVILPLSGNKSLDSDIAVEPVTDKHNGEHKGISRHANTKPAKKLRLLLIMLIIIMGSGTAGYVLYADKERETLAAELKSAIQDGRTEQAHRILKTIEQHGYTSEIIVSLVKQLSMLDSLANSWDRAQQMLSSGMLTQAYNAALPFTLNTSYHSRAVAMIMEIQEKQLKGIIQTATTLYAGGNKKQAEQLLNYALEKKPGNKDAQDILAAIRTNEKVKHVTEHTGKGQQTRLTGDEVYKNGGLNTAIKFWSENHSKDNRRKIVLAGNINKYLNLGRKAYDRQDYASAVTLLEKAAVFVSLLGDIGIRGSADEYKINSYLGVSYSMLGMLALSGQAYRRAREYFEKSLNYEPANQETIRGFSALNDQADKLYKKAYTLSVANRSEACRLYKDAILIAQKDTDVYKKIKRHIATCGQ